MARKRTLKPGFFTNEDLGECSPLARLLFAGLWCWADREGRVEDRPRKLKGLILPFDNVDGEDLVNELAAHGFVTRYEVDGVRVLQVVEFLKHQDPHPREASSELPGPAQGEPRADLGPAKVPPRSPRPSRPSRPSRSEEKPRASAREPAPPPETTEASVTHLPGRETLLATEYPATTRLLDALLAAGVPMRHASKREDRLRLEQLAAAAPLERAVAEVKASSDRIGKLWLGWHEDALVAAGRPAQPKPDDAWLDALPPAARAEWDDFVANRLRAYWDQELGRAEARAALQAKYAGTSDAATPASTFPF